MKRCQTCIRYKSLKRKNFLKIKSRLIIPRSVIYLDVIKPITSRNNREKYIICMIDKYTQMYNIKIISKVNKKLWKILLVID